MGATRRKRIVVNPSGANEECTWLHFSSSPVVLLFMQFILFDSVGDVQPQAIA